MPRRARTTGPARPPSSSVPSPRWNSARLHCSPPPSASDGPLSPSNAPAGPRRACARSSSRALLYPTPSAALRQRCPGTSCAPARYATATGATSPPTGRSVRTSSRQGPKGVRYARPPHAHPHGSSSSRKQHVSRDTPLFTRIAAARKTARGACYKSAPLPPASHSAPTAARFYPTRTHPATIPIPPTKSNQLWCINNLHAYKSHPSPPL